MGKCEMKIELLSDLCVSDGGTYNSMIDIDVCYDKYGFPYIPAKRIRGCLRECGQELNEWYGSNVINITGLFGKKGHHTNRASIRISDAYIEGSDEIRDSIIKKYPDNKLLHPQNILGMYTSIRSQTSMDYESGTARPHSLRTTRVINKGLTFVAHIDILDEEKAASIVSELKRCCKMFRHMGLGRTRGLGKIKASIPTYTNNDLKTDQTEAKELQADSTYRLDYSITLLEPVICKAVNGGEQNSLDYIEGSKMMGIIASDMTDSEFILLINMKDDIIFSNAYITKDGERLTEVPGYIYSIKNDKDHFINKMYETELNRETKEQLNQMKHSYVKISVDEEGSVLLKSDVEMEIRNHHRRPADKSIGRAMSSEADADFYQISSIAADQVFKGYIIGNGVQIEKIEQILKRHKTAYIGYSRMSEYGKVNIVTEEPRLINPTSRTTDELMVNLVSPALIYNDRAMHSTDSEDLLNEILACLGIGKGVTVKSVKKYVKYTSVGGFNVTWGMRKPTVYAFNQGTSLHIKLNKTVCIPDRPFFIGERNNEGFGECHITLKNEGPCKLYRGTIRQDDGHSSGDIMPIADNQFLKDLSKKMLFEQMRFHSAAKDPGREIDENMRATVSNMILLASDCSDLSQMKEGVKKRYDGKSQDKEEKLQIANEIIKIADESIDIDGFCKEYGIRDFKLEQSEEDQLKMGFLVSYLADLKYRIRSIKGSR